MTSFVDVANSLARPPEGLLIQEELPGGAAGRNGGNTVARAVLRHTPKTYPVGLRHPDPAPNASQANDRPRRRHPVHVNHQSNRAPAEDGLEP